MANDNTETETYSIAQIADTLQGRGIDPQDFWTFEMGGDRRPMQLDELEAEITAYMFRE